MWVKLADKLPNWPCIGFIRPLVMPATDTGMTELTIEKKLFVVPCGRRNAFTKTWAQGVWINTSRLEPFLHTYDLNKANAADCEAALMEEFFIALEDCEANEVATSDSFRFQRGSLDDVTFAEQKKKHKEDEIDTKERTKAAKADNVRMQELVKAAEDGNSTAAPAGLATAGSASSVPLDNGITVNLVEPSDRTVEMISHYYQHAGLLESTSAGNGLLTNLILDDKLISKLATQQITSYMPIGNANEMLINELPLDKDKDEDMGDTSQQHGKVKRKSQQPGKYRTTNPIGLKEDCRVPFRPTRGADEDDSYWTEEAISAAAPQRRRLA